MQRGRSSLLEAAVDVSCVRAMRSLLGPVSHERPELTSRPERTRPLSLPLLARLIHMDWIRLCLDPFRSCMGAPMENELPEEQQQQSATEHTPLLSDSSPSSSGVTRREKGLGVVLLDGEGDMVRWALARPTPS